MSSPHKPFMCAYPVNYSHPPDMNNSINGGHNNHHHRQQHQQQQQRMNVAPAVSNNYHALNLLQPQPFVIPMEAAPSSGVVPSSATSTLKSLPVKLEDIKSEFHHRNEYIPDSDIGYINRIEFVVRVDKFSTRVHYTVCPRFQNLSLIIESSDVVRHMRNFLVVDLLSGHSQGRFDYIYQISVVKGDYQLYHTQEMRKSFVNGFPVSGSMYHLRRSVLTDPQNGFLVNDTVSFFVTIEQVPPIFGSTPLPRVFNRSVHDQLVHDYSHLLSRGDLFDAKLVFPNEKNRQIAVHKIVLAARSPVFAAMFTGGEGSKETKSDEISITDVTANVFEILLTYIYTGKLERLEEFALDLMTAANNYQLTLLKEICEQCVLSNLTPESVVSVLNYADHHNSDKLRQRCISFITAHSTQVLETESWRVLIDSSPQLLAELYADMAAKTQHYFRSSVDTKPKQDNT